MQKLQRQKTDTSKVPAAFRAKWGIDNLEEGFIPLPKMFLRVMSEVMGSKEYERLQVALAIVDYLREDISRPPSLQYLAFIAGLDEQTFKRHAKELTEAGLVDVNGPDGALMISAAGLKQSIKRHVAYADHPPAKTEMNPS